MVEKDNKLGWKTGIRAANITLDKISIFISGKAKTNTCNWPNRSPATAPAILETKKTKTAKEVFNRKFLLSAYLQLLPPRYNFYE